MLMDPTFALVFYGSILSGAVILCIASGDHALQKLALWSFVSWVQANYFFFALGKDHAPWLVPSVNALITVAVAHAAIRYKVAALWETVRLFTLEAAIVVGAFALHQQGEPLYYLALNMVFLGRMFVLGGAAFVGLARRLPSQPLGLRHLPVGRP